MSTAISYDGGLIEPTAVLRYESSRDGGNIIHPILGRSNPDVTFRDQQLRTGTLSLGFAGDTSEDDSLTAFNAHAAGIVFTLASTDLSSIEMSYVVSGPVTRTLDVPNAAWIVDVTYQEVSE